MVEYTFTFAGFMPTTELNPQGTFSNGDEQSTLKETNLGQYIYKTEFTVGPDATERQEKLFTADLNYAVDKGYEFIQIPSGQVFQISHSNSGISLLETDVTEEYLQEVAAEQADISATEEELEELVNMVEEAVANEEEYCKACHNIMLVDDIINNTLTQDEAITPQQADTMLKLAHLKKMLLEGN